MTDTTVSEGFNGGTVTLQVGETLTVELRENPTTGFRWAPTSLDASMLARIDDDFRPAGGAGLGGGGLHVFRLRAVQARHDQRRMAAGPKLGAKIRHGDGTFHRRGDIAGRCSSRMVRIRTRETSSTCRGVCQAG